MPMLDQIMDQRSVLPNRFRTFAIADASGLHDALIAAHVVHQSHKTLVQHLNFLVKEGFGFGDSGAGH